MDLAKKWNEHLRRESRRAKPEAVCPLCGCELQSSQNGLEPALAVFQKHLSDTHAQLLSEKATEAENTDWIRSLWDAGTAGLVTQAQQGQERRAGSPTSAKRAGSRSRSVSPLKRSKAQPTSTPTLDDSRAEFDRGSFQKGKLWSPDDDAASPRPHLYDKANGATHQQSHPAPPSDPWPPASADDEPIEIIKQPETRPISQEQLVAEVKGIYAGLVMVESKCIEVDNAQSSQNDAANKLNNEQWQALIALHRTLLHEHHDFFLASQHPSASPALRRLAAKYAMPARMWRHGIHSFLELLRHRLPASLDHMLTFIYLAYSMMALLYETVPAFEDTWIECLGDLGRYRMAIEDDDVRDREIWTAVSRHWYSKASDKAPTTGRLYHHLAILARPNALQQLYYYTKSLCVDMPFASARDSIMTLLDPIMAPTPNLQQSRLPPTEFACVKAHGILFSGKQQGELEASMNEFFQHLDTHIGRTTRRWLESGYFIGISNSCAVIGYGSESNLIFKAIKGTRPNDESQDQPMHESGVEPPLPKELADALRLFNGTYNVVSRRFGDPNILPYLHVTLVFVYHLTFYPEAMVYMARAFPWKLTSLFLNTLIGSCQSYARIEGEQFPKNESATRPLPDDYALRGFPWVGKYFPNGWFANDKIDDDEKYFEVLSMTEERKERALWLGCRIAAQDGKWLRYDSETHQFGVNPQYDVELELEMPATPVASTDYGDLPDAATIA
ncbi:hypothetical protein N656DRAFT_720760 [Canariomyces notabilis]|uniref:DNA/RNA-binding domain-containing protein n=1 Tax=Canariomyces notabilis TaxID=2074819 RepID=A0AAN6QBF4_9PEZI|nr:hypothetical protein N656DRAFT_720760 [Canariomyces arenarius]